MTSDLQGHVRRPGYNRVFEQKLVVQTVQLNQEYLYSRRYNTTPFYPHLVRTDQNGVMEDDLCFSLKDSFVSTYPLVFSTFNGDFGNCNDVWDIIEKIRFVGIARGESIFRYEGPQKLVTDISVRLGGSFSIINKSTQNIAPGQWLVWTLPEKGEEGTDYPRGTGRITAILVPYDPVMDDLTHRYLKMQLSSSFKKPVTQDAIDSASPGREKSAKKLIFALKSMMFFGIYAAATAGIIDVTRLEFLPPARVTNRNAFLTRSPNIETNIKKLAMSLGLIKLDRATINENDMKINILRDGAPDACSTDEFFLRALRPSEKVDYIYQREANKTLPFGYKGELLKLQSEYMANLFDAINSVNFHQKERIVGRAISPGKPGFDFDILMGSGYMV